MNSLLQKSHIISLLNLIIAPLGFNTVFYFVTRNYMLGQPADHGNRFRTIFYHCCTNMKRYFCFFFFNHMSIDIFCIRHIHDHITCINEYFKMIDLFFSFSFLIYKLLYCYKKLHYFDADQYFIIIVIFADI